jgi:hypothetical protein
MKLRIKKKAPMTNENLVQIVQTVWDELNQDGLDRKVVTEANGGGQNLGQNIRSSCDHRKNRRPKQKEASIRLLRLSKAHDASDYDFLISLFEISGRLSPPQFPSR